jgi:hypothetical protein
VEVIGSSTLVGSGIDNYIASGTNNYTEFEETKAIGGASIERPCEGTTTIEYYGGN